MREEVVLRVKKEKIRCKDSERCVESIKECDVKQMNRAESVQY
jgi:hypothetical protein